MLQDDKNISLERISSTLSQSGTIAKGNKPTDSCKPLDDDAVALDGDANSRADGGLIGIGVTLVWKRPGGNSAAAEGSPLATPRSAASTYGRVRIKKIRGPPAYSADLCVGDELIKVGRGVAVRDVDAELMAMTAHFAPQSGKSIGFLI